MGRPGARGLITFVRHLPSEVCPAVASRVDRGAGGPSYMASPTLLPPTGKSMWRGGSTGPVCLTWQWCRGARLACPERMTWKYGANQGKCIVTMQAVLLGNCVMAFTSGLTCIGSTDHVSCKHMLEIILTKDGH